jgi:lysophospholipase L1-like esterase
MFKKVCILGNSISLLLCPPRKLVDDKTYHEHLEAMGYRVINASKQSVMLKDVYRYLEDEVIRYFPEYIIINMGIVEATFRTKSRWLHNYVSENAWNNNIINIGYCSKMGRGLRRIAKKLYRPLGNLLYFFHLKWRFMPPRQFQHALRDIVRKLIDRCPVKKVIILGMLPISKELERIVPGTRQSVAEYNLLMERTTKEFKNVVFVSMADLFVDKELPVATIDSIHYTAAGHEKVAKRLAAIIEGTK